MGLPAPTCLETTIGYIRWYFVISHPYIIRQQEDAHILRPLEQETIDELAVEEHGDQQWLECRSHLARIRDHALAIVGSGQVVEGSPTWISLHAILHEAQEWIVYRRRRDRATQ